MLPTEDPYVYVYVLIRDLMRGGAITVPPRPGPDPACTDAELLAIAVVRHLLGRRSEASFLAEVARDWGRLFPVLPHQSEANRRTRWLWGAFEQPRFVLAARLPEDAAHAEWFYGFRLAAKTDLGSLVIRAWSIVPAAVSERGVATDLLKAGPAPRDLLADKGFSGRGFAAAQAARGAAVPVPPGKKQRAAMPSALLKVIAERRNRIETTSSEITCLSQA
jgi:Transposase DDE domain